MNLSDLDTMLQEKLKTATIDDVPEVIGNLEKWKARFQKRLFETSAETKAKPEKEADEDLTKEQAAKLLNVPAHWLSGRKLPFKRKFGHRTVRFSKAGLLRWKATRIAF